MFLRDLFIIYLSADNMFVDVLILSKTWNDLFLQRCGRREQMLNYVFLSQKRWFQYNSRIGRTHFASAMTLNNCERIAETRSYIFRWRSRCLLRRLCLKLPTATINGQNRSNSYTMRRFEEAAILFELHSRIVSSRS